ncbi:hypothetical protein TGAM01_v208327 [Trichoderma gamsii]|uniref:Uncharacterized protein n=1 Tax=Trichoderma gamsii TaxID=398673 RepID=A0A0W7VGK5_9HYPO|nr:hypothetical protein TGAM01_v208327 [Trichoderma gamsii]PNP41103.1 hypothetical protein TGAMA5MH_06973 [Trichoderma gamsii]PON22847.1 hypothetical protein TGAM01_v208327 [Trichoderma gamsii]
MGPPKTRGLTAPQNRSRFHEGSMNDRVSAVPPEHFLGPGEIESLERPLEVELEQHQLNLRNARRSQDTQRQLQLWLSQAPSIAPSVAPSVAPSTSTSSPSKKGMLGKVWDGVRGRLQLKKEAPSPEQPKKADSPPKKPATANIYDDRPTREEALASYHLLVESGFFTSHAIQSTRQPPPPGFSKQRPATSASHQMLSVSPNLSTPPQGQQALQAPPSLPPPLKFPLNTTPKTPKTPRSTRSNRTSLGAMTAASADSRGTKRTVTGSPNNNKDILIHQDERDDSRERSKPEIPREARKKIRKSTSKDFTIPVLRTVKSTRKLVASRSNRRKSQGNASLTPVVIHHYHSHSASSRDSKHSKRSSHLLCAAPSSAGSSPRSSIDSTSSWRESGDSVYSVRAIGSGSKSSRGLRPRKPASKAGVASKADADAAEALKVVPNANRGIPGVPSIPAKYTFGEDRENGQVWRGLRR